ncbi:ribosome-associated GTPase [Oceanobacter sp. RED65]|uniref:Ribosome-associated GTPase n=1 Tax=Bermanella marisrubri TaxID=207949 RepID=Q1N2S9_9GAMM|nr:ribosome-associated GTPase [Oceanobacter sp. RED65] [Bermanella marisrubri]
MNMQNLLNQFLGQTYQNQAAQQAA